MNQADSDVSDVPRDYPGCLGCGHYRAARCVAYPKRIPLRILSGEVHHLVPRPGQVGDTVFEEMDLEVWRTTRLRVPLRATASANSTG